MSGQIFGLIFLLSSVIDGFEWFWMERLHKNIQLMLEFLKAPFLVLHFSCYTLMTFLMLSCNIAIYADDTTLYSSCDWASYLWQQLELNLNIIYETLWTGVRSSLLISMLGKLSWFRLTGLKTMVLLM